MAQVAAAAEVRPIEVAPPARNSFREIARLVAYRLQMEISATSCSSIGMDSKSWSLRLESSRGAGYFPLAAVLKYVAFKFQAGLLALCKCIFRQPPYTLVH